MTSPLDSCRIFAERIQAFTGGPLRRLRREFRVRCPSHEADGLPHDPSLAIWARHDGGLAYCCMSVCPWPEVRRAIVALGIEVPGAASPADRQRHEAARKAREAEQRKRARELFATATTLAAGDPVHRYLARRGLHPKPEELTCFRTARGDRPGEWLFVQAVVRPSRVPLSWAGIGVQLTVLNADGSARKEVIDGKLKTVRRIIGSRRGGGVVIGKPRSTAVIGEGVETVLSALRLLGLPFGIASCGPLDQLVMPSFVDNVVISVDGGRPGEAAAERARRQWHRARRTVTLKRWGPTLDANDVLMGGHGHAG